ncbi:histidine triad nucleotide-binding protein [Halorhodospira halophila]|uniref:histidine triad nucleotide-binding protein n=1 Tax=Halorhodospira halophila TaxID=1053 RepID=UPI0019124CA9|nr:histidine triad nucleotide-binding protein [Halorhodospira halophila]MBK5942559.1 histidine triad nucleotide-binding protein [Halorhodospira halophila]
MTDCIFCKIVAGELPAEIVHSGEHVIAFRDLHPQAPTHILIIPRRHVPTLHDLTADDGELLNEMFTAARTLAEQEGLSERGYRTVFNCKDEGGQEIHHLHLHLLGGRQMTWPPG